MNNYLKSTTTRKSCIKHLFETNLIDHKIHITYDGNREVGMYVLEQPILEEKLQNQLLQYQACLRGKSKL